MPWKKTRPDQRCEILLPELGLRQFCRHGATLQKEKKEAIRKLFEVRLVILPGPSAKPSILESGNQHVICPEMKPGFWIILDRALFV